MYRVSPFVDRFARALLGGAALATLWVNLAPQSYYDVIEFRLADLPLPDWVAPQSLTLTPMGLVSDALMALFLFFLGKELWEALVLERGALAGRDRLVLPLGGVLGGVLGAVALWVGWGAVFGTAGDESTPLTGWTVPIGSDVVLCYVMGRLVFGRNHPALHLLLLVTIAFDILGLLLTGIANPVIDLSLAWLALPAFALAAVWAGFGRLAEDGTNEVQHRRAEMLWPYVLAGLLSWTGVALSGLPPVLGLLPLIPLVPHAERSFGLFAEAEEYLHDPLNRLAHLMVRPLPVVLLLFGLTRGGVDLAALDQTTGATLAALWIGKPLGLFAGTVAVLALARQALPSHLRLSHLALIALLCGMGFTAPVLSIGTALPGGAMAEAARLGLALSLLAGPAALLLARLILPRP